MKTKPEIWCKLDALEKQVQKKGASSLGDAFVTGVLKTWIDALKWVLEEG